MTTCGIHGTPVVDRRCADCDAGTVVYFVTTGSSPDGTPWWTVIMYEGSSCKGGDRHWLSMPLADEAMRRYNAGTAKHGELYQVEL